MPIDPFEESFDETVRQFKDRTKQKYNPFIEIYKSFENHLIPHPRMRKGTMGTNGFWFVNKEEFASYVLLYMCMGEDLSEVTDKQRAIADLWHARWNETGVIGVPCHSPFIEDKFSFEDQV